VSERSVPRSVVLARPRGGGVGAVAGAAARELRARGWVVREVAIGDGGVPAAEATRALRAQRRAVRGAGVLHVELGALDLAPFWFGVLAAPLARATVVVAHDAPRVAKAPGAGLIRTGTRWPDIAAHRLLAPALDRPLLRVLAREADVGVVLSEAARAAWRKPAPAEVLAIDHGADPPAPGRPAPSAGRHVLCAGFVGPAKGIDVLLDAWSIVGAATDLPLVIAGTHTGGAVDDRHSRELRERGARLDRPPLWTGWVSEEELRRLVAEAAIVVAPFRRSNPVSGVVVRAMVEGRAIAATRVPAAGALRDGVDAMLVEPGDAPALARALGCLLADPALRDRLGDAAARAAAERFTWDRHVAGLEAAYERARERRCASR
jgi:glycosyltransferase involved in cell wall biosynthesis